MLLSQEEDAFTLTTLEYGTVGIFRRPVDSRRSGIFYFCVCVCVCFGVFVYVFFVLVVCINCRADKHKTADLVHFLELFSENYILSRDFLLGIKCADEQTNKQKQGP